MLFENNKPGVPAAGRIYYWILRNFFCRLAKLIWVKKIKGMENLPKSGPYIIAVNHSSYLDFMLIIGALPQFLFFFIKDNYYDSPLWNYFLAKMNQIRAANGAFKKGLKLAKKKNILVIFPEGTRTRNGSLGSGLDGVAKISIAGKIPVIPVGISGAFGLWPPQKKFPKFKREATINFGKLLYPGTPELCESKDYTQKIMGEIEKLIKNSR